MRYALFMLIFCSFQLGAQQVIQWQKCLGSADYETIRDGQQTSDKGYVFCGRAFGNGGDIQGVIGNGDFWITKLDSTGSIEWQTIVGGTANDVPHSIQQTLEGGYIVAGVTESNDVNVSNNHGMADYWVVKLSKNGILEWAKTYGGTYPDECYSVRQTIDGGYVLAGKSGSLDGDVTGTKGFYDFWIVRIDSIGDIIWQKTFGGSNGSEYAYCIELTNDKGFIIAGETNSKNGDVTGNHGDVDFWIVKIDSLGGLEWQKTLGGSGLDGGAWIQPTKDGGYITTGSEGSGNTGNVTGHHGGQDAWVVKLDSTGQIQWQKALGGADVDYGSSINEAPGGDFILAGNTSSIDGDVQGNDGGVEIWVVTLSPQGNLLSQNTFGGTDFEKCEAANLTIDGGVIVFGYTSSNNGDVNGLHGEADGWVVKLSPTNTPTLTPTLTQLSIYPNPTNQQLTLQTSDNEPITSIQITDLSGKMLKTEQAPQDQDLQVDMLPKGMYLLKVTSASGQVFCGRFIKE